MTQSLAHRYLELAGIALVALDRDGRVTLVNGRACRLIGRDHEELMGQDWFAAALGAGEAATARAAFADWMIGASLPADEHEQPVLTRDGAERLVLWRTALVHELDGRVTGVLLSGEDITERRRAEERIAYLAYHDGLTGLANHTLLEEHLTLALARARRGQTGVALLQIDVDNFRLVNDTLGHTGGDELLCRLAVRLAQTTRSTDLLARLGGDQMLLMLADVEGDVRGAAEQVAASVLEALDEPFLVCATEFEIGASIGIALCADGAGEASGLLRQAQAALEHAKEVARGAWAVYDPNEDDPRERLGMTGRLRRALERGEFALQYQPIFALGTGELVACEALLRWHDPVHGLVPPATFIPLAEETGLIEPIGDWVVGAVCEQQIAWAAEGFTPSISFNVSPRQLRRLDFVPRIAHHLLRTGADAARLVVELTESATLNDPARVEPLLEELHDLGLGLAIDDFGAGYSSLSRLRHLPVQTLKIDRSFLREVPGNREATTIIKAIVRLTRALGMATVAEGVESAEQHDFLVGLGCPLGQGFLMARPVSAHDALALSGGGVRPWERSGEGVA